MKQPCFPIWRILKCSDVYQSKQYHACLCWRLTCLWAAHLLRKFEQLSPATKVKYHTGSMKAICMKCHWLSILLKLSGRQLIWYQTTMFSEQTHYVVWLKQLLQMPSKQCLVESFHTICCNQFSLLSSFGLNFSLLSIFCCFPIIVHFQAYLLVPFTGKNFSLKKIGM